MEQSPLLYGPSKVVEIKFDHGDTVDIMVYQRKRSMLIPLEPVYMVDKSDLKRYYES